MPLTFHEIIFIYCLYGLLKGIKNALMNQRKSKHFLEKIVRICGTSISLQGELSVVLNP